MFHPINAAVPTAAGAILAPLEILARQLADLIWGISLIWEKIRNKRSVWQDRFVGQSNRLSVQSS